MYHLCLFRLKETPDVTQPDKEAESPPTALDPPEPAHSEAETISQRSSLISKAIILNADELVAEGMLQETSSSSGGIEATAAESEGEISDFDSNPIIDEDDVPPMPDTPEMGNNVRSILRRLSTGGEDFETSHNSKPTPSPLAQPGSFLKPTSMKLTFSPSGQTCQSPAEAPQERQPSVPSSPLPPPLPSEPPPSDDEGPSLPPSLPPDEAPEDLRPAVGESGGISPSVVARDSNLDPLASGEAPPPLPPRSHEKHEHHHHHPHEDEEEVAGGKL